MISSNAAFNIRCALDVPWSGSGCRTAFQRSSDATASRWRILGIETDLRSMLLHFDVATRSRIVLLNLFILK